MSKRDPRTDPEVGDVLTALNGRTRTVTKVEKNDIYYRLNTSPKEHKCWKGEWLEWCTQNVL
jgi:hypothetical protein